MRARAVVLGLLSSTAVLAVGWQLGTQGQQGQQAGSSVADAPTTATTGGGAASESATTPAPTPAPTPSAASGSTGSSTPGTTTPATAAPAAPTSPTASGTSGTFTGTSTRTRYGNVQVEITVENGILTDVTALQLTDQDPRSVSISNRAAPVLREQVLAAQSANVQGVSGATYTSDAYLTSLQSALDQAGL